MGRNPQGRKAAPRGLWLAALAIAGQLLLPFLLAFEIALAAPHGDGEIGLALCSITQHAAVPPAPFPHNNKLVPYSPVTCNKQSIKLPGLVSFGYLDALDKHYHLL